MGFSQQEYWSVLPFPSLGDLPDPGMEPASPALQVDSLLLSHLGRLGEAHTNWRGHLLSSVYHSHGRYAHRHTLE